MISGDNADVRCNFGMIALFELFDQASILKFSLLHPNQNLMIKYISKLLALRTLVLILSFLVLQRVATATVLYSSDRSANAIYSFDAAGNRSLFMSGFFEPANMAFNAFGDMFVADQRSGNVFKIAANGVKSTFASGVGQPFGIAIDGAGNIFVSDTSAGGRQILSFTSGGTRTTFATGFSFPLGIAFDRTGDLFVADFNRITRVTPNGTKSLFGSAPNGAVGLSFAPGGDLYLTNDQRNVTRYAPDGTFSLFGNVVNRSAGIAVDSFGNVFVSDRGPTGFSDIYKFSSSGVRSTFALGLGDTQALAIGPIIPIPEPSSFSIWILGGMLMASNLRKSRGRLERRRQHHQTSTRCS